MFEIGVNSNTRCGENSKQALRIAKDVGFENVMVSFKSENYEQLLVDAKELGLNVCCVHLDSKYASDLWVKGESCKRYIESMKKQIEVCSKHGVKIAVLHPTSGSPSETVYGPTEHGLKGILEILEEAKRNNVQVALENLDAPNYAHFEYLMENVSSDKLKFCYDAGHHNLYYPEKDLLAKYGDRLVAVHLHDNLMDWEFGYDFTRDLHFIPGDGKVDYEKICKNIANTSYNGVILLEIHKKSSGAAGFYFNLTDAEFMKKAYISAEKIARNVYEKRNVLID